MPNIRHLALAAALVSGCSETTLSRTTADVLVDRGVDLGTHYVGDVAEKRFAIHSTGNGRVWIEALREDHAEVTLHWDTDDSDGRGTPVPSGGILPVTVRWKPTTAGSLETRVEVRTSVEGKESWTLVINGIAQPIPSCDDGNPCTDDWFERSTERCRHRNNDDPCSDGSACTVDDACHAGVCRGVARDCNDDNVCTLNLCDPAVGCIFPPDGRVCDDGDPCTDNVCDPDDGCSYPNADVGTPCGTFDCATGHVCFFGDCREIDITGQSDGYPCFDGDVCTSDDTCQAGECLGGPVLQAEPEVVASFETFGGESSTVATDGYRYLFADPDALRLAVPQGIDGEQIVHVATVPFISHTAPVLFEPGKFVVSNNDVVALIDATDVSAPIIAWELYVYPGGIRHMQRATGGVVFANDPYAPFPQPINGGTAGGPDNEAPSADREDGAAEPWADAGPYFLPIAAGTGTPSFQIPLSNDYDIRDLAADGNAIAWVSGTVLHWLEYDGNGAVLRHLQRPMASLGSLQRVSVHGDRVAVLGGAGLEVWQLGESLGGNPCEDDLYDQTTCEWFHPGCAGNGPPAVEAGSYMPCPDTSAGCPGDAVCELRTVNPCVDEPCAACGAEVFLCVPRTSTDWAQLVSLPHAEVRDLVLSDGNLYRVTTSGVDLLLFEDPVNGDAIAPMISPLDAMSGHRLDRGPGSLLLSGTIALPLTLAAANAQQGVALPPVASDPPTLVRITGPRHGNLVAITDAGGSEVLVGGRVAWARIDLAELSLSEWQLTDIASGATAPRILRGNSRDAVVSIGHSPQFPNCDALPVDPVACDGTINQLLDATGQLSAAATCDNYGHSIDVAGGSLFSYGTLYPEPCGMDTQPSAGLRVWSVEAGENSPVIQVEDNPFDPLSDWWATRVRAADGEPTVALLTPTGLSGPDVDLLRVRLFDAGAVAAPLRFDETLAATRIQSMPSRDRVGVDGSLLMLGEADAVQLYDLAGLSDPVWPQQLAIAEAAPASIRVSWMANGRAWVGWNGNATTEPGPHLSQLTYDAGGSMVREGDVSLPSRIERLYDSGGYSVATTPTSVVILAPACR